MRIAFFSLVLFLSSLTIRRALDSGGGLIWPKGLSSVNGCVAKNKLGHKNAERYFSSGGNIEESGHESNLSANVAFPDPFNLPLPYHVHDLIPSDGSPRRVETEEAESWIDPALYESVVLFEDIILG